MRVEITLTTALYPTGQFVQWRVLDCEESGEFFFTLERSGGPEGPWTLVMPETSSQYAVRDLLNSEETTDTYYPPNQLTVYDRLFYKVTCRTPSGARLVGVATVGDKRLDRVLERYFRKNQRDFRLSLKFNGTPVVLLKRRWWGERCLRCTDPKTRKVVRADCRDCWGTGFVGGYWNPVATFARRTVNANNTSVTPEQKSDSNGVRFWLPDFPTVERDDVIIALKTQRRYRIDQQVDTELKLVGVHQVVTAQEFDKDHLIYRMKVQTDILEPLY